MVSYDHFILELCHPILRLLHRLLPLASSRPSHRRLRLEVRVAALALGGLGEVGAPAFEGVLGLIILFILLFHVPLVVYVVEVGGFLGARIVVLSIGLRGIKGVDADAVIRSFAQ